MPDAIRRVHWRNGVMVGLSIRVSRAAGVILENARRTLPPGILFHFFVGAAGAGAGAGLNPEVMLRTPSDTPTSRRRLRREKRAGGAGSARSRTRSTAFPPRRSPSEKMMIS